VTAVTLAGGTIVDGTGAPARPGNVVVDGDRIVAIGPGASAGRVLDVGGLVVAPGFVDIHSHVDWVAPLPDGRNLLGANVLQGITTTAAGNCGISPAPLGRRFRRGALERMLLVGSVTDSIGWQWDTVREYLDEIERRGLPLNLCLFVGHSTLRATVLGEIERPATPGELTEMCSLLEEGLRDGAVGLSIGLEYYPGRHAGPSELDRLAAIAAKRDALVALHTRGISALIEHAFDEAIGVARRSRARLQLSHVNPMGKGNWGAVDGVLQRIDDARLEGLDVGFDIIGYTAWTMSTFDTLPHVVQDLGLDAVLALCANDDGRTTLRSLVLDAKPTWPSWPPGRVTRNIVTEMGFDALVVADAPPGSPFRAGEDLASTAGRIGIDPFDAYLDLMTASVGGARIVNVGYGGDLEDDAPLRALVARPDAIPETDTIPVATPTGIALPLPLFHGTMARFLGHFSRDLALVGLEDAVRRITSLPANRLALAGRGSLEVGGYADIVAFDAATIADAGTFLAPGAPAGIVHVVVNGTFAVEDGHYDPDAGGGRALRRAAAA